MRRTPERFGHGFDTGTSGRHSAGERYDSGELRFGELVRLLEQNGFRIVKEKGSR